MGTVRAEITIDAAPDAVWATLSDLSAWSTWNDVMVDGRCDGGQGSRLSCRVRVGPTWVPVDSRAIQWRENEALIWGEDRGRIFRLEHGFQMNPVADRTRVVHFEHFEGVVGRLIFPVVRRSLTRNYTRFLEALRDRVEADPS